MRESGRRKRRRETGIYLLNHLTAGPSYHRCRRIPGRSNRRARPKSGHTPNAGSNTRGVCVL